MHFGSQAPALIDGKLPVFVFPTALNFYSNEQDSHKQVLTLYNPYDFVIKFKVLCTSPKKFSVVESEGSVKSRCCVDVVIRHKDICINNEGLRDKFRIQVSESGQKKVIGTKDVVACLYPKHEKSVTSEDKFESLNVSQPDATLAVGSRNFAAGAVGTANTRGPSWVIVTAAILCIVVLMMPSTGDKSSLPAYAALSLNQKLIAAYILGLVTMAVLRS